jgi:hypothetical protein
MPISYPGWKSSPVGLECVSNQIDVLNQGESDRVQDVRKFENPNL